MSAAQASSTRSALCSSSRISGRGAQPRRAGVGVGGGDQGAGLVPVQADRGGVVRVDAGRRTAVVGIARSGHGSRSTGRTTDSADRRRRTLEAAAPASS